MYHVILSQENNICASHFSKGLLRCLSNINQMKNLKKRNGNM